MRIHKGIDLNILLALKVLLEELNVSSAGKKLKISQPTMSKIFQQLKAYFKDPILIRAGNNYIPTPKAMSLKQEVDLIFSNIDTLLSDNFIPDEHSKNFVIAAPDYVQKYVLSDAIKSLFITAKNLTLTFINWDATAKSKLISGDIHLAISIDSQFPGYMHRRIIDEDELVLIMCRQHPLAQREITTASLLRYPHVVVDTGGGWSGMLDPFLRDTGMRNIRLSVQSYDVAFANVCDSDMLLVVPKHVARNCRDQFCFEIRPLPFASPKIHQSFWWHGIHQNDTTHRWLREALFPILLLHPKQLGAKLRECDTKWQFDREQYTAK